MPAKPKLPHVDKVNNRYLETLLGYNARRVSLAVIEVFLTRMAVYELRIVDFSVLSLINHNPGITSRQLCATLNIQAPNLVQIVNNLETRDLINRQPHPMDGRAMGLHLTAAGLSLVGSAEKTAAQLEVDLTTRLTDAERKTLLQLLKKVYK